MGAALRPRDWPSRPVLNLSILNHERGCVGSQIPRVEEQVPVRIATGIIRGIDHGRNLERAGRIRRLLLWLDRFLRTGLSR